MRRPRTFWISAATGVAIAVSGCTSNGDSNRSAASSESCGADQFSWTTSKDWRLVVLDDPVNVKPGGRLEVESKLHEPRKSQATDSSGSLSQRAAFKSLSQHLGKELARPNTSTSGEKREMSATFDKKAQAVYYRGVKAVSATYTYNCPGTTRSSGTVFTWEIGSSTTGLVDCLAEPEENSQSRLARMAISERCPEGVPARKILNEKGKP